MDLDPEQKPRIVSTHFAGLFVSKKEKEQTSRWEGLRALISIQPEPDRPISQIGVTDKQVECGIEEKRTVQIEAVQQATPA